MTTSCAYLTVVSGPMTGQSIRVPWGSPIRVGRGAECEIDLCDFTVSRNHLEIRFEDGVAVLYDVQSRWGTLVNGRRTDRQVLAPGDVIRAGEIELRWMSGDEHLLETLPPWSSHPSQEEALPRGRGEWVPELPPVEAAALADVDETEDVILAAELVPAALLRKQFGRYLIHEIHAQARRGIIFKATEVSGAGPVTLKVYWPKVMQRPAAVRRFLRTIRTMCDYQHPNLVALLDGGIAQGLCWTASEFVVGRSVKAWIGEIGFAEMLDWRRTLGIAFDMARALDFCAGHGLVHRNITPTNILVRDEDGVAKLGDLYLARALDESQTDRVTLAGEIVGELNYLSPEQTIGEAVDQRSDLYSLGATLYALLTGRPPFVAVTTGETLRQILKEPPVAPRRYQLAIPDLFEAVVLRLLAKRPEDRFATPAHFLRELERVKKYT